jgi:hypothetical protein
MAVINFDVTILDEKNRIFPYMIELTYTTHPGAERAQLICFEAALKEYLETVLGYESGFKLSSAVWQTVSSELDFDHKVILFNSLCANKNTQIKKMFYHSSVLESQFTINIDDCIKTISVNI